MRSTTVIVIVLAVLCDNASADADSSRCMFYRAGNPSSPSAAAEILEASPESVVEICSGAVTTYREYARPRRGPLGACFVEAHDLARLMENGKPTWRHAGNASTATGRRTLFAVSAHACPAVPDPTYVFTKGVSEGVFLHLSEFWGALRESPSVLSRAATAVLANEKRGNSFTSLLAALSDSTPGGDRLRLESIAFYQGGENELPSFEMTVRGSSGIWSIDADVGTAEVVVLGVGTITD